MAQTRTLTFALCSKGAAFRCTGQLIRPSRSGITQLHQGKSFLATSVGRRRTRCLTPKYTTMVVDKPVVNEAPVEEEIDPGVVAGTDLRVLRYPHPLLRASNATIEKEEFNDSLRRIIREMLLVMYASKGVGLAAPQVGINKRLMVFNPEGDSKAFLQEVVMINPEIVASSKKTDVETEACLSFPGMGGNVRRNVWVKVEAYRLNGKKFKVKYEGWQARIFQHEFDHLEGKMYVDRLEPSENDDLIKKRLEELIEDYRKNPFEGLEPAI